MSETNEQYKRVTEGGDVIKKIIGDIDRLSKEMKEKKKIVKDALMGDAGYKSQFDEIKEYRMDLKKTEERIMKTGDLPTIKKHITVLTEQIKQKQDSLTTEFNEHFGEIPRYTIEDNSGALRIVDKSFTVVK